MKILITNDDGIKSEGLRHLVQWARKVGDVFVVAPKNEQSAKAQSINLREAFEVKESDEFSDLGIRSIAVDSTPADCIRYAIDKLEKFDMVFSGINRGLNLGYDVAYSGTCGATFEANYSGVPAAAFSAEPDGLEKASKQLDAIWEFVTSHKLFEYGLMYNINIPKEPRGIRLTVQGGYYFRDHFIPDGDDMYRAKPYVAYKMPSEPSEHMDIDAIHLGFCSISPLVIDRTDKETLKKLLAQ